VPFKVITAGGRTYEGFAAYIRSIFTGAGFFIAIYILIGVFHNTALPHLPAVAFSLAAAQLGSVLHLGHPLAAELLASDLLRRAVAGRIVALRPAGRCPAPVANPAWSRSPARLGWSRTWRG